MLKSMLIAGALAGLSGAGYLYHRQATAREPVAAKSTAPVRPTRLAVSVIADRANAYSRPWDGVGYIGGIVGPVFPGMVIESPPDMILCVVEEEGASCLQDGTEEAPESYCHDAFHCEWSVNVPARGPFALVVYDSDVYFGRKVGDLVDAVIVNPNGADSRDVEEAARHLVRSVAPTAITLSAGSDKERSMTWRRGEERRRAQPMRQIAADSCTAGCRLEQSDMTFAADGASVAEPNDQAAAAF